jgi:hypothetical protein
MDFVAPRQPLLLLHLGRHRIMNRSREYSIVSSSIPSSPATAAAAAGKLPPLRNGPGLPPEEGPGESESGEAQDLLLVLPWVLSRRAM